MGMLKRVLVTLNTAGKTIPLNIKQIKINLLRRNNMPSTDLSPSHPLTILNTNPPPGVQTPPNRFILFGSQWFKLQNYITQALQLPINQGSWDSKYGDFSNQQMVTNCLNAMTNVHNLSADFGDPSILKTKICRNPNYLLTPKPPTEIYGHIVWLANQISNTAGTFSYTLASLKDLIGPAAGTPQQRADNLKLILVGDGGLASMADDMKKKTSALLAKLLAFEKKLTDANEQIVKYAGSSSDILTEANRLVGELTVQIDATKTAMDAAYKKWRDLTIAAVVAAVGIMILTGGLLWPVALAVGGSLGAAAAMARHNYNNLCDELKKQKEDKTKKTQLVTDLTGLNASVALVSPAMTEFISSLQAIEGVWTDVSMNLAYIVNNYGVDQLGNLTWVMQAMKIMDAQNKWGDIKSTTQQFTQNSLVSYEFTRFGEALPKAA